MTSNQVLVGFKLTTALTLLSALMFAGNETVSSANVKPSVASQSAQPVESKAARALSRSELLQLEDIARRAQSMMSIATFTSTRVWPHGVRDRQGRLGIFLSSQRPVFNESTIDLVKAKEAWVVFALLASVKYSEGSQLEHIAFTDSSGETGERWYYDISIAKAREIHDLIVRGILSSENAFKHIEAAWQRVTPQHEYAVN